MYRFLSFVLLASAISTQVQTAPSNVTHKPATSREPQIKVISANVTYINTKYYNNIDVKVVKHNETYNNIQMYADLCQDFPVNPYINLTVYLTDSKFENARKLVNDLIPLCANSPDHDILPQSVWLPTEELHDACIKKGVYKMEDTGQFRFEELIPNVHEIGDYYLSVYTIFAGDEILSNVTLHSQWGYSDEIIH